VTLVREKKDALMAQRKVSKWQRQKSRAWWSLWSGTWRTCQAKMEEEEKRHQQMSREPATTADTTYNPLFPDAIPRNLGDVLQPNATSM